MQETKGEETARPWGTDVLQAYMDKQLGKECVAALRSGHKCISCSHEKRFHWAWALHAMYAWQTSSSSCLRSCSMLPGSSCIMCTCDQSLSSRSPAPGSTWKH